MRRISSFFAVLVTALAVLFVSAPAQAAAGPIITQAGNALKSTNIYLDSRAELKLTGDQVYQLKAAMNGPHSIFVAVLPNSAIGEVGGENNLPNALATATNRP